MRKTITLFLILLFSVLTTTIYAQDNDSTKTTKKEITGDSTDLDLSLEDLMNIKITGTLTGTVIDKYSLNPLGGVKVEIIDTKYFTATDDNGKFKLDAPTGSYNLKATALGYRTMTKYDVVLTSGNDVIINFEMEDEAVTTDEVTVTADRSISVATAETPNSVKNLTTQEIKANPGGNFDITRVVQSLPGVGTVVNSGGFRNDLIIRGGGPSENVYYLDGVEIPVINHFTTQGAAGGPTGIINVSFIEDVTLYSSSFHSRYDNALSSVLQFKQRDGNPNRFQANLRLSSSEVAVTGEGPLSKKTTILASFRRSYLQLLFEALDQPIRPNYWDFQAKITHKFNNKTSLSFIGIGAIDEFKFGTIRNTTANNKRDSSVLNQKQYNLRSSPFINQWNYTVGLVLKRSLENGYIQAVLSRNMFDNQLDRFEDNKDIDPLNVTDEQEKTRTLGSKSQEIENKLRIEMVKNTPIFKYQVGASLQYVRFTNDFYAKVVPEIKDPSGTVVIIPAQFVNFTTSLDFFKVGFFGHISKSLFKNKLNLSLGLRSDMNSFTTDGMNPLNTISPRFSVSYAFSDKFSISGSLGRYYKILPYTALGYKDNNNEYVNRDSKYIQSDHIVAGLEYMPTTTTRFTLEGFYKFYNQYPASDTSGISLANLGAGFSPVGFEDVSSVGKGETYGMEFFAQQKLWKNFFGVLTYTLSWSNFTNVNGQYFASNWDTRHTLTVLLGKKFKRGWEIGAKYRFSSGSPYTPFDTELSRSNFILRGQGTLDYTRLNSLRTINFNQIDIRVDKKWNFKKWSLDIFVDVTNVFGFANPNTPVYAFERDADGKITTTDGNPLQLNGSNATPIEIVNDRPIITPSLGIIVEF